MKNRKVLDSKSISVILKNKEIEEASKMDRLKFLELKPFSQEKDDKREFDLIRAVVIFKAVRNHPNKSKNAIAGNKLFFVILTKDRRESIPNRSCYCHRLFVLLDVNDFKFVTLVKLNRNNGFYKYYNLRRN